MIKTVNCKDCENTDCHGFDRDIELDPDNGGKCFIGDIIPVQESQYVYKQFKINNEDPELNAMDMLNQVMADFKDQYQGSEDIDDVIERVAVWFDSRYGDQI